MALTAAEVSAADRLALLLDDDNAGGLGDLLVFPVADLDWLGALSYIKPEIDQEFRDYAQLLFATAGHFTRDPSDPQFARFVPVRLRKKQVRGQVRFELRTATTPGDGLGLQWYDANELFVRFLAEHGVHVVSFLKAWSAGPAPEAAAARVMASLGSKRRKGEWHWKAPSSGLRSVNATATTDHLAKLQRSLSDVHADEIVYTLARWEVPRTLSCGDLQLVVATVAAGRFSFLAPAMLFLYGVYVRPSSHRPYSTPTADPPPTSCSCQNT